MDEQRVQAYLSLIQELLDCDSGEEAAILSNHPELIDEELVQVMRAVAEMMAQQGQGNAGWLRNFAGKIEAVNYELPRLETKLAADTLFQQGFQQYQQSQYPQAGESVQQSLALYQEIGDKAGLAKSWRQLGFIQRNRGNWDEAEHLYRQSLALSIELDDRSGMATCWGVLGDIQELRGNWDEAERLYQKKLDTCQELGDKSGMSQVIGTLGDIQKFRGNWDEAERLYQQSLTLTTELDDRSGMAYSWGVLGDIQKLRGNWDEAERLYQKKLDTCQELGDKSGMFQVIGTLGKIQENRGNWDEAEHLYRQSLALSIELDDRSGMATCWGVLGDIQELRGNWDEAERLYQKKLDTCQELGDKSGMSQVIGTLGDIQRNRGNWDEAERLFRQSLAIETELGDRSGMATCWGVLGDIQQLRGNWDEAEHLYRQSLAIETELGDRSGMASSWGVLGKIQELRGNWDEAELLYQQSLALRTELGDRSGMAAVWGVLGNIQQLRGNWDEAELLYQQSLAIETELGDRKGMGNSYNVLAFVHIHSNKIPEEIACLRAGLAVCPPAELAVEALLLAGNLGNTGYNLKDWETAIEGYDNAIRAVEQSRDWATSPQIKQQLIADALPLYGKMVEACLHLERYDQALLTVERSKARTLIELLHNSNRLPQNASAEQLQRYEQLNREIAALQYALDDSSQPRPTDPELPGGRNFNLPNSAPATDPLRTLLEARKALLKEINDPTFNEFETVKAELPDFGQLLNPTTALIEWFLPQDPDLGAYAFLVTHQNGQTQIHPHRYSPAQRRALDEFNETYNHDDRQDSWYEALDERLDTLAQLLDLPTLLTHRPDPCHHLILIPHLYLHLFPLHALSLPSPSGRGTRSEGQLLQDEFPEGVRYAPSCQILAYLHNRPRTRTTAPFFAIQNPTEDLPYADVEIDLIRPRFDPSPYILKHKAAHKAALEESTTRAQLHNSEIVHFACHGGFDSANPLNSALILAGDSPPNPDSRQTLTLRDGRRFDTAHQGLTAAEIYRNLKLTCRLVILSACETGRLDSRTTDEYIGLASALLYAGSGTVVDTLWCVDDFATAFLSVRFYEELTPTRTIPQAIKAATTWLRTRTPAQFLDWCRTTLGFSPDDLDRCELRLSRYDSASPFAPRLYWSAFRANGLE
ncbi:CHAT domain-containing protein [Laspinema palackyanum]|uniref:CHAT domain-containing protein n=1 Tax=Laspinema palackyanum TaxID=3231601 RepID=UPI00349FCB8E